MNIFAASTQPRFQLKRPLWLRSVDRIIVLGVALAVGLLVTNYRTFRTIIMFVIIILVSTNIFISLIWVLAKTFQPTSLVKLLQFKIEDDLMDISTELCSKLTNVARYSSPAIKSNRELAKFDDSPGARDFQRLCEIYPVDRAIPCATSSIYAYSRKPIVIDVGSSAVRLGYAHQERPSFIHYFRRNRMEKQRNPFLKDATFKFLQPGNSGLPQMSSPFQSSAVNCGFTSDSNVEPLSFDVIDWDALETAWKFGFDDLQVSPTEQPLFLTWDPALPASTAEKMAAILFEDSAFRVPALYFGLSPVLGMYASGRTTGCSLHSGAALTHACAVYEGYAMPETLVTSATAGDAVSRHLGRWLDPSLHSSRDSRRGSSSGAGPARVIPTASMSSPSNASLTLDLDYLQNTKLRLFASSLGTDNGGPRGKLVPHVHLRLDNPSVTIFAQKTLSASIERDCFKVDSHDESFADDIHVLAHLKKTFTLPDGTVVSLSGEEVLDSTCEHLFRSDALNSEAPQSHPGRDGAWNESTTAGETKSAASIIVNASDCSTLSITDCVLTAISRSPSDLHGSLWQNVVLSGGNTSLRHFDTVLTKSLTAAIAAAAAAASANSTPSADRKYDGRRNGASPQSSQASSEIAQRDLLAAEGFIFSTERAAAAGAVGTRMQICGPLLENSDKGGQPPYGDDNHPSAHVDWARSEAVWLGGSVLSDMDEAFLGSWVTREEYEEHGPEVLHLKCQTRMTMKPK